MRVGSFVVLGQFAKRIGNTPADTADFTPKVFAEGVTLWCRPVSCLWLVPEYDKNSPQRSGFHFVISSNRLLLMAWELSGIYLHSSVTNT